VVLIVTLSRKLSAAATADQSHVPNSKSVRLVQLRKDSKKEVVAVLSNRPLGTVTKLVQKKNVSVKVVAAVLLSNKPLGMAARLVQPLNVLVKFVAAVLPVNISELIEVKPVQFWKQLEKSVHRSQLANRLEGIVVIPETNANVPVNPVTLVQSSNNPEGIAVRELDLKVSKNPVMLEHPANSPAGIDVNAVL